MMRKAVKAAGAMIRDLFGTGDLFGSYPPSLLRQQTDDKSSQIVLSQFYRRLLACQPRDLPRFDEIGFRQYSQNDEDGILLYLFALVGTSNKRCLEICAG